MMRSPSLIAALGIVVAVQVGCGDRATPGWKAHRVDGVKLEQLWGASANDIWAIGGTPPYNLKSTVVTPALYHLIDGDLRRDTELDRRWSEEYASKPVSPPRPLIWGTSSEDIWLIPDGPPSESSDDAARFCLCS